MAAEGTRAIRIGGHAAAYLAATPRGGRVASLFRHGLNVLLDADDAPTYVTVQTSDAALHPWAIEVRQTPTRPAVGSPVRSARFTIEIVGTRLDLSTAVCAPLHLVPYDSAQTQRALCNRPVLDQLLAERQPQSVDSLEREIGAVVARWHAGEDAACLSDLVGLGPGSTPAGDDILVGVLTALTAQSLVSSASARALVELRERLPEVRLCTHPASWQMIRAALDGSFPQPLLDLVAAMANAEPGPLRTAALRVLRLGATSGRSLLAGFQSGLAARA